MNKGFLGLMLLIVLLIANVNMVTCATAEDELTIAYTSYNSMTETLVALTGDYTDGFVAECNMSKLIWNNETTHALARNRFYDGDKNTFIGYSYKHNTTGWFYIAEINITSLVSKTVAGDAPENQTVNDRIIIAVNSTKVEIGGTTVLTYDTSDNATLVIDKYDVQGNTSSFSSGNAYINCYVYGVSYQVGYWIPTIISCMMLGVAIGFIKKFRGR